MNLQEQATMYYSEQNKNCAVAILLAGNDVYGLGLSTEDAKLVVGFGGGMGCGSTCGALAGSIAVLGKLFAGREEFRQLCGNFVKVFQDSLSSDSGNCSVLMPRYKTDANRCEAVVARAAELLESYIEEHK